MFNSCRKIRYLLLIVGGNSAGTHHGGPIAPTVLDDALFELRALDIRPVSTPSLCIFSAPTSSFSAKMSNVTVQVSSVISMGSTNPTSNRRTLFGRVENS
jgi:hypothetical protein